MNSQQTSPGHIGDCPRYNSHSGKLEPTVVMLCTEPHPKALTQPLPAYAPPTCGVSPIGTAAAAARLTGIYLKP